MPRLTTLYRAETLYTSMPRTMHRHEDVAEFILITEGSGIHIIDRQRYYTQKGDLLLTVPAHSPVDGAIMLLKWKQHCTARKIKWDGKRLMLLSYDHELDAEPVLPEDVQFIGRCARLEAAL